MGPKGRWVEVQIRSERMNEIAEKGFAAHYKYKHKEKEDAGLESWLNKLQKRLKILKSVPWILWKNLN